MESISAMLESLETMDRQLFGKQMELTEKEERGTIRPEEVETLTNDARKLIGQCIDAGARTPFVEDRQRLLAIIRHWGNFVFERTREFTPASPKSSDIGLTWVGMTWEKLRDACRAQAKAFCDGKIDAGVFDPDRSVARKEVQQNILQFLESNSAAMVLTGAAGVGKTFLICQMAYQSLSDETQFVLAYDSLDLPNLLRQLQPGPSDTLGDALGRIIARDLGYPDFSALERELNYLAHVIENKNAHLLVCFDGLDTFRLDNRPPDHLMVAINALVERFAREQDELCRIKFIITCLDSTWDLLIDERQLAVHHYYHSQAGRLTWPVQEFTEEEFKEAYQKYANRPADGKTFQETKGVSQKHPYLLRIAAELLAKGEAVTREMVFNIFYERRVRRGSMTEQIRKERFLAGLVKGGYTEDKGVPALDVDIDDPAYDTLNLDGIITQELTRNPLTRISEYVLKLRPRGLAEYLRERFSLSNKGQPNQAEGTV
ncbi:MAG: hypothetical protein NT169_02845 [Chloroflexi bacterium]|nr:hypothetical protein [Chloroflexota bacterium]